MPVLAVVGGQWGDEGKGKIIDLLAGRAHVVVRAQGGDNAGHTVVNPRGKFALHLVPAGIFNEQTRCLIGPGVALNPETLLSEMDELARRGVVTDNLVISARAHLVMPYHPLFDRLEEQARGQGAIGTTGKGIGPTYADKVARGGIVAGDLLHLDRLAQKVRTNVSRKNVLLEKIYGADPVDADAIIERYRGHAERLGKYIAESEPILEQAIKDGRTILLEGGHGTLLDLDHGTYPYVTTTSCTVGGLLNGAGIGPKHLTNAIGVFKAYQSRVGAGAMPSELADATGDYIRERGHEYGTTTGRPRRVGWFDAVAARHSMNVNGFHTIALTRIDILDELDELRVCVAYEMNGQRVEHIPSQIEDLAYCTPVYEGVSGWGTPTGDAQTWKDLPGQAQAYVKLIEDCVGAPAGLIGVGQEREKTIFTGALP
ncbi:MAG: adenylosuccinate synthase [Chloroflexi bacterium]|nr:adenylosuccinate synthase [Chloroflexota bacterium]